MSEAESCARSSVQIGEVMIGGVAGTVLESNDAFSQEEKMLQAIVNWWRGYSRADMESVKERLSYPNNSGSISIHVTNPERRALRDLRNLRKPSRASLKPSSSLKPLDNLPEIEVRSVARL
jgi:NADPH-dependent curcumin reductase CurA